MTLQQLKYIIKIVECGSMTEAAKQLYLSQPSLSNAVKELESSLGIEIFTRTTKGISLTTDGVEFLSYCRQVVEQTELLEQRYLGKKPSRRLCSISTQHYSFAVNAFVSLVKEYEEGEYEFTLRETRTNDIIEDVKEFRSEVGILYLSEFNRRVLLSLLKKNGLEFHPLFEANPHVFVSSLHPLANREWVEIDDLEEYPRLSFEQGENNSFYFSEELLSTVYHKKSIQVSDRATMFNLMIGLNGYTICSGVIDSKLNGTNIVAVRMKADETMQIGWISNTDAAISHVALRYIELLTEFCT